MSWFKYLLICGGMGIYVSNHEEAQAVSVSDEKALGVVSGVNVREAFIRILQLGDPNGEYRKALKHWPYGRTLVKKVLRMYFRPEGVVKEFLPTPSYQKQTKLCQQLDAIATFCEVWLAKNGRYGRKVKVGLNLLEKAQVSIPAQVFGGNAAGVDFIFMGAGIPTQLPAIIDRLVNYLPVEYKLFVKGSQSDDKFVSAFDPVAVLGIKKRIALKRPKFFAIVSSLILALKMQKAGADGVVFENKDAGGHNAPPRKGDSYGEKDEVDWREVQEKLSIPYVIAGAYASREDRWEFAKSIGASAIQFGTPFALCDESGLRPDLKAQAINLAFNGELKVRADFRFSTSEFPFQIAEIPGTLADLEVYASRERKCNKFCLMTAYRKDDGTIGWRCPGSKESAYVSQGGNPEDCQGRGCLCNGLLAAVAIKLKNSPRFIGLGDSGEPPIVTLGQDTSFVSMIIKSENEHLTVKKVVEFLSRGMVAMTEPASVH